jgi:creatinine amidohydrolase
MLLENLAYTEVETYLEQNDLILVPVGSVEQHSPYGIIGTDFVTAEAVARKAAEVLNLLVAPTLCYGVSPHHMGFKGTVSLSTETLAAVAADIVRSLAAHGFRRIVFVNGHGGNVTALKAAFERLKNEGLSGHLEVISWYELKEVSALCKRFFGREEGQHATPGEVSVTRYLRPAEFSGKATQPQEVKKPGHYWPLTGEEFRRVFPDGRMASAPWLATGNRGRDILQQAAAALAKRIEKLKSMDIL